MEIEKLPVDFVDDVLNTDLSDKRRYNLINNPDGTISLEDVTTYRVIGSDFGAEQVNQTNETINELIDESVSTSKNIEKINKEIKEESDKDFILVNQKVINFVSGITATLQDNRITADSLADVYFTTDCYEIARKAYITVDTYEGRVVLTAGRPPEGTITATIHIRVV